MHHGGRESSLRAQAPGDRRALLEALVSSAEWVVAQGIMLAVARRCCRRHVQDVVAEAGARLLKMVAAGEEISTLPGYAARVARSAARWLRRGEHAPLGSEHAAAPPARTSFDDLMQLPDQTVGLLRGATQRRIVDEIRKGRAPGDIAELLGQPAKEIRRQIKRLARQLCR